MSEPSNEPPGEGIAGVIQAAQDLAVSRSGSSSAPQISARLDFNTTAPPLTPELIALLQNHVPDAAERALQMAEKEQNHRHDMDRKDVNNIRAVLAFSAVAVLALISAAIVFAARGDAVAAAAILGAPTAAGTVAASAMRTVRLRNNRPPTR